MSTAFNVLRAAIGPVALAVLTLGLLVFFDLGPPLAFNDDWMYAWAVRRLAAGHLALYPATSALALPQIGWADLVTLGHTDERLLRLTLIPFVVLGAVSTFQSARRLGADRFWSSLAGLAVSASPLFIANATSFMSDIPYTALVMAATWNGLRWQQDGKGKAWTGCFVVAATLQRQIGAFVVPALTVALWLAWRAERPRVQRWLPVAVLWVVTAAAALLPQAFGLSPAAASTRLSHASVNPVVVAIDLLVVPGEIGLALIPFAAGLLTVQHARPARDHRGPALIVLGGALVLILLTHAGIPISGDNFAPAGLMDVQLPNSQTKPLLYPWPLYETVMGIALVSFAAFAVWRWGAWRATGPAGALLALIAASQFVPWFVSPHFAYDRYFLPIAAPLVPIAAWVAGRSVRPRAAQGWAITAVGAGLVIYAAGEQDYQAWQAARDQSARLAYQTTSPEFVNAGYEANAAYWEVPYYDRTGKDLSEWSDPARWDFAVEGPRHPRVRLEFAPSGDPRAGTRYESLAPGKVVIEPVAEGG